MHLAYSIADQLAGAGKSVVFVTVGELLRKIKSTFNKDSSLTVDSIIRSLVRAEVLIVDDLGAELGALDANTKATNLTGERLEGAYDERIVSRIVNNFKALVFKDTKDFRRKALPF